MKKKFEKKKTKKKTKTKFKSIENVGSIVDHRHISVPTHTCDHWGENFCNISTINNVFISDILYIAFHYVCINRHALNIVMQHRWFSQELLPSFVFFLYLMKCNVHIFHVYPQKSLCYSCRDSLSIFFFLKGKSNFIVYFYIDFKLSIQTILEKTLLVVLSNKLFVTHMIVVKIQ